MIEPIIIDDKNNYVVPTKNTSIENKILVQAYLLILQTLKGSSTADPNIGVTSYLDPIRFNDEIFQQMKTLYNLSAIRITNIVKTGDRLSYKAQLVKQGTVVEEVIVNI